MSDVSTANGRIGFLQRNKKEPPPPEVNEYAPKPQRPTGDLVSATVIKFCDAAADRIEQDVGEILGKAETFAKDARQTAVNIRQIGRMESERTVAFYATMKGAMDAMIAARRTFDDYMANARKVVEEARADTSSLEAVAGALNGDLPKFFQQPRSDEPISAPE